MSDGKFRLNAISLEFITREGFMKMADWWGIAIKKYYHDDAYAVILNPVIKQIPQASSNGKSNEQIAYECLFRYLSRNAYADQLCVYNPAKPGWEKTYIRSIEDTSLEELALIASKDRFKKGYLEMKFKNDKFSRDQLSVAFIEYKGKVIGTQMMIPSSMQNLLTIHNESPSKYYKFIKAIWVPEDYKLKQNYLA